jgi:hypothetical protein
MRDAVGRIIGIRLRKWSGYKFAVPGSHNGLYIPDTHTPPIPHLLIAEGTTDTAALLSMGLADTVGRPSCSGGTRLLIDLVRLHQVEQATILAHNDEPGVSGAESLASRLAVYVPTVRIIKPPIGVKDARVWLQQGATAADVTAAVRAASPWIQTAPQVAAHTHSGLLRTPNGRRFFLTGTKVSL